MDKLHKLGMGTRCVSLLVFAVVAAVIFSGCTRRHYREGADNEVASILAEKDVVPFWKIEDYHVYPDGRARFADPTNPDRPIMPPDDPAAAALAPNPQRPKYGVGRLEGYGWLNLLNQWNAENRLRAAQEKQQENPADPQQPGAIQPDAVPQPDPLAEKTESKMPQPFLIKLDQASELGLINSREYQARRENLYLATLPVTLERFAFTTQFFAAELAIREWAGRESNVGQQNRWVLGTTAGFSKLFSTGALLLFQFANNTVINLTGDAPHTISTSDINLDFVQPFLRGGGRAVTLEPLTQSERNLVYEIRDYARFRKQFYTALAGGIDFSLAAAITSRLGVGLSPGNIAGFGGLQISPGGVGRLDLGVTNAAAAEGYLPTLLRSLQLNNEQKNVTTLEQFLSLFEDFEKGGKVSPLQVSQVRTQLLQGLSTVLQREQELRDGLDRFKIQLGVPVNTLLELDQSPIRSVLDHLQRFEAVFTDLAFSLEELKTYAVMEEPNLLRPRLRKFFSETKIVQGTSFREQFNPRWAEWAPDKLTDPQLDQLVQQLRKEQKDLLVAKAAIEEQGKSLTPAQQQRLAELDALLELGNLELAVRAYEAQPWKRMPDPQVLQTASSLGQALSLLTGRTPAESAALFGLATEMGSTELLQKEIDRQMRVAHADQFQDVNDSVTLALIEARNQRFASLGKTWPELPSLEVGGQDLLRMELDDAQALVAQTALANRLDLMNQRAQLVDVWRQIRLFANSLLGTFDVAYHFDSRTPPGQAKPLAFSGSRSRHQLIFNAELPLVRLAERNAYRASLIAYQRERRNLMAFEDSIAFAVRSELRQLRVLEENYKIQRQAVELQYIQVENALDTFNAPPTPEEARRYDDTRAAALTTQLLNAQARLPQVQNQLFAIWINYQITRLQLYLDLELMPLDSRGVWIDELATQRRGSTPNGSGPPGYGETAGQPRDQRDSSPEFLPSPRELPPPPLAR